MENLHKTSIFVYNIAMSYGIYFISANESIIWNLIVIHHVFEWQNIILTGNFFKIINLRIYN